MKTIHNFKKLPVLAQVLHMVALVSSMSVSVAFDIFFQGFGHLPLKLNHFKWNC